MLLTGFVGLSKLQKTFHPRSRNRRKVTCPVLSKTVVVVYFARYHSRNIVEPKDLTVLTVQAHFDHRQANQRQQHRKKMMRMRTFKQFSLTQTVASKLNPTLFIKLCSSGTLKTCLAELSLQTMNSSELKLVAKTEKESQMFRTAERLLLQEENMLDNKTQQIGFKCLMTMLSPTSA